MDRRSPADSKYRAYARRRAVKTIFTKNVQEVHKTKDAQSFCSTDKESFSTT